MREAMLQEKAERQKKRDAVGNGPEMRIVLLHTKGKPTMRRMGIVAIEEYDWEVDRILSTVSICSMVETFRNTRGGRKRRPKENRWR